MKDYLDFLISIYYEISSSNLMIDEYLIDNHNIWLDSPILSKRIEKYERTR